MAKDPAMLWYWNDWHSGTVLLNRFLKGCYMDLLHAQFNHGHLSVEEIQMCLGSDFEAAWGILKKKFKVDNDGLFFNEKLDTEKEKRKSFSESRRSNLTKKPHMDNHKVTHMKPHMVPHMENENENRNVNKNKKVFVSPSIDEVREYFKTNGYSEFVGEKAFNYYNSAEWKDSKGNQVKNWKQKMQGVWFKDENKIIKRESSAPKESVIERVAREQREAAIS